MVAGVARRCAWISAGVISVKAPAGGASTVADEKPDGETAMAASLLAELKPGASGAQPWTSNPTAANMTACNEKLFKSDSEITKMNTFGNR